MRLLEASESSFVKRLKTDSKLKRIARKARDSTSYEVANEYAVRAGELLSASLKENLGGLAFISEDVAREVLTPTLTADHDLIAEVSVQIQKNMNEANGFGIEALAPELDTNRIEGLISKLASYDTTEEGLWVLGEPVINYSQAVTDQTIRKNFQANSRMGIEAKIVRKAESAGYRKVRRGKRTYTYKVPCKWCAGLEGTYDYSEVKNSGNDVYRRHENCRCTVTYIQGGRRQDTWSKASWTDDDANGRAQAVQQRAEQKRQEEAIREQNRQARLSGTERIMRELGYSPKGAAILYNTWKGDGRLERLGLDYLIDMTRNEQLRRRS